MSYLSGVEVIAVLGAVIVILKSLFFLFNRSDFKGFSKNLFRFRDGFSVLLSLLALVVFYFLIREVSVVHIFVSLVFASLLMGLAFLHYPAALQKFMRKVVSKSLPKTLFYLILVWVFLALWVLWRVFFF